MPLSVSPSSSVYMKHIVEIEPGEHGDRVAFVRANISHTTDVSTSLYAFKSRLMARSGKARQPLIGYEIVLGLKGNALPEDETAALIDSLIGQRLDLDVSLADHIDSATFGFHMMGISPTRAVRIKYVFPAAGSQCRSLCWVLFPYERITNWRVLLWGTQYQVGNLQTLIIECLGAVAQLPLLYCWGFDQARGSRRATNITKCVR